MKWHKFPRDGNPPTKTIVLAILEEYGGELYYDCITWDGKEFTSDPRGAEVDYEDVKYWSFIKPIERNNDY